MQYKWLNKQDTNKNLIVFFNGWGMDEKIVSNLEFKQNDVLMFYDYRNFEVINFDFSKYENKSLIAWSLGVYVCNYYYESLKNFNKYTAINGTQNPINDNFGIPVKIYDLTTNNFNELSRKKFMKKISDSVDIQSYCSRTTEDLKTELESIGNLKIEKFFNFNKAYISLNDKIIPAKNQINYWKNTNVQTVQLNGMHYIFNLFKSWEEIL